MGTCRHRETYCLPFKCREIRFHWVDVRFIFLVCVAARLPRSRFYYAPFPDPFSAVVDTTERCEATYIGVYKSTAAGRRRGRAALSGCGLGSPSFHRCLILVRYTSNSLRCPCLQHPFPLRGFYCTATGAPDRHLSGTPLPSYFYFYYCNPSRSRVCRGRCFSSGDLRCK